MPDEETTTFERWLECKDKMTLQEFTGGYWYLWCPKCGKSRLVVQQEGAEPHICKWGRLN